MRLDLTEPFGRFDEDEEVFAAGACGRFGGVARGPGEALVKGKLVATERGDAFLARHGEELLVRSVAVTGDTGGGVYERVGAWCGHARCVAGPGVRP